MQESFRSLGYAVVGPYGRLAEAIEGAETQAIDFAILDLNLNGEMTDDLAVAGAAEAFSEMKVEPTSAYAK